VNQFLLSLAANMRPSALEAVGLIERLKQEHTKTSHLPRVFPWDKNYYLSFEPTRPMHPLPPLTFGIVFRALSRLFTHLYGISLRPVEPQAGELWHHDVQKLEVVSDEMGILGWIYTDLFVREGKGSGAAHYTIQTSRRLDAEEVTGDSSSRVGYGVKSDGEYWQLPIVVLMCDFSRTNIMWQEVQTLFHEMGHAIHSMVGRTEYHNVSGTRCATDFVELPSILMEHFLTSPQVLSLFHDDPGKLRASDGSEAVRPIRPAKGAALDALQQIIMSMLDQACHSKDVLNEGFDSSEALVQLESSFGVFPYTPTKWPAQFGHLYTYGANYYSYLFDRAIAHQVWTQLFLKNPLSREGGERFKNEVLRWGGSKDPWKMISSLLSAPHLSEGGPVAMIEVGKWGIANAGVAGQDL